MFHSSSPSRQGRSALFDDAAAKIRHLPGPLQDTSDEHIERLIAKNGAVALVRQLAADLAERDAEISTIHQRAQEREGVLKKMLREMDVSSLDIETRLHKSTRTKKINAADRGNGSNGTSPRNSIDDMLDDAMADVVGTKTDMDEDYPDIFGSNPKPTIGTNDSLPARDTNSRSLSTEATAKGWKSYLWNNTPASRKTSGTSSIEVADTPLEPTKNRSKTSSSEASQEAVEVNSTVTRSRNSSASAISWTLKLFAGNPTAGRDVDKPKAVKDRAITATGEGISKALRKTSTASAKTGSTAIAALKNVNVQPSDSNISRKSSLSAAVTAIVKGTPQDSKRNITSSKLRPESSSSSGSADNDTNPGVVEMDTIHPPDSRPPTSTQTYSKHHPTNFLTDSFGFIYDHDRTTRQWETTNNAGRNRSGSGVEMVTSARDGAEVVEPTGENQAPKASSSSAVANDSRPSSEEVDEKTGMKWEDYLKASTYPTELLSHTPAAGAITTPSMTDVPSTPKRAHVAQHTGSLPSPNSNPEPATTAIVASNAEFTLSSTTTAIATTSPPNAEHEPVKHLLRQLTDLHDSLQRDKTARWNKFLLKVRSERKREDDVSKQAMPEDSLTDGEMIGFAGLGNKGKVGQAVWKQFTSLVLGGIPVAYRAKIWAECSGAAALRAPGYYEDLVKNGVEDPGVTTQIQNDISRTLTDNVYFRKGPGVAKLKEVLLAYAGRNPEVGYCQGMNMIAASLLLIMPTAEEAFWVLASLIEQILPEHYYDRFLLASRADQQVLRQYVGQVLPRLSAHLDGLGIEFEALTFQWFLSVFTGCLSAEALFRVWDVILCTNDGSTFLFQVALALLKLNEKEIMGRDSLADVYEYINHDITNHAISIDGLIRASDGLKRVVKRADVEERRAKAVEEERERMRVMEVAREGRRNSRARLAEAAAAAAAEAGAGL